MKKILLILVAVFSVGVFVAIADNEKIIDKSQLPKAAQEFIDSHFADADLLYAKEDSYILFSSYEVMLSGGVKLEFSNKGNWEEVNCRESAVPAAIIPQPIKDYVVKNHAGESIVAIEKDHSNYEVRLSNSLELKFDRKFNLYDIDD